MELATKGLRGRCLAYSASRSALDKLGSTFNNPNLVLTSVRLHRPPPLSSLSASSQFTYSNPAAASSSSFYFPMPFPFQQPQYPPVVYPALAPAPAQQLFQRDAQTITTEALESVKVALANSEIEHKAEAKKKAIPERPLASLGRTPPTLSGPKMYN